MAITERQLEQRRAAGRASYRAAFLRMVNHNRLADGSVLVDQVAMYLSCFRLNRGFKKKSGLTSQYCVNLAFQLGIDLGPRPRLW
jgi:predicted aminopeptidase